MGRNEHPRSIPGFDELLALVGDRDFVFIQTHDFPDHDAVASAFALARLFEAHGATARMVYEKEVQRESLVRCIRDLAIAAR
ncbi:MAG: hypothetical protein ACLFOY_10340 [Desulfatibacillaceae bacterium]